MHGAKKTTCRSSITDVMTAEQQASFTRAADALLVELIKQLDRPHKGSSNGDRIEGKLGWPAGDCGDTPEPEREGE
ncbi:MAG TPA: hypothetical protein VF624_17005 [Tepidisphaeraceae bacterium]